ncbi:MAG: molecular chaperone HscC [Bradyrhizobium sp.]|uniref:molecular chaperone HscC n=1 Tax=Bradyrhizobium sp. TaxID=376 RepID=UPI0025BB6BDA|nr:molecular chaperone HscC [Bradyrhizobium sp.]MBI5261091.1 molecular chaperone HscC [Bradyrhizobium sp.]
MIVGIDLGTTNSLIATWHEGASCLIPNALGEVLTPSAVSIDDNGEILVGLAARERVVSHPERSAASFKRYMGTNRRLRLADREFRPEELSSFVLRSLKADAEAFLGEKVHEAVITVPAYFNDTQRKATGIAGEMAGLNVVRLLNEPTAAALAYGLQTELRESKFLVFDLGGGTFDVSVLDLFEGVIEVRAVAGDNFLGGEDFVDVIIAWFQSATRKSLPPRETHPATHALLRRQAELAMRRLSEAEDALIETVCEGRKISASLSRTAFAREAATLLERLRRPVERALRDSQIRSDQLTHVVLAGGATRMPMVRRLAGLLVGRPALHQINPDEVVARGAAVQAGLVERAEALSEIVLTDVAPYSLGIDIVRQLSAKHWASGQFLPIIERNTIVPTSRSTRVHTLADNQTELCIRVYQGESRLVADNIQLGEIAIEVPPAPAGEQAADVRFTYDVNGLLEVDVLALGTGELRRTVIEQNPGAMTPQEIEERLAALATLKIAPRERSENRALLARAERIHEEALGNIRQAIAQAILAFEDALQSQEPGAIEEQRRELTQLLDRIEHELRI